MSLRWHEAASALDDARSTMNVADSIAKDMARALVGRLRKVNDAETLRALKRELSNYNTRTEKWKP